MKRGTPDHPKVLLLMSALALPRYAAVGILETLWHWAGRYAIQGDIGKWPDVAIASGIGWRGDPSKLVRALVTTRWIDEVPAPSRLVIHDLQDHADNTWRQNMADAGLSFWDGTPARGKVGRREKLQRNSSETPEKLQLNSSETPEKLQRNSSETPQPSPPLLEEIEEEGMGGSADSHPPFAPEPEDAVLVRTVDGAACPECAVVGALKRNKRGEGWFCGSWGGGCSGRFPLDDPEILRQLEPAIAAGIRKRSVTLAKPERPPPPARQSLGERNVAAAREATRLMEEQDRRRGGIS